MRKVSEDCLVGWGARHEFGQGSGGGWLREESGHDGALRLGHDCNGNGEAVAVVG